MTDFICVGHGMGVTPSQPTNQFAAEASCQPGIGTPSQPHLEALIHDFNQPRLADSVKHNNRLSRFSISLLFFLLHITTTAPDSDEFHQFVDALAADADFADEGTDLHLEQEQEPQDLADEDVACGQDAETPSPKKMDRSVIDILIEEIEKACGPVPTMDNQQYPLTQCGQGVPNVIGTYLLHGIPAGTDAEDDTKHRVYCGQAMSVKPRNHKSVGLRQRSQQHWSHIYSKSKDAKNSLHAYDRLGDVEIARVEIALLSAFPFPRAGTGEALRQFCYIASLVETIDILLIGSISQTSVKPFGPYTGLPHGLSLQPGHIPQRSFEGLNRALPIKQMSKIFGHLIASTTWSTPEIRCLMSVIERNEEQVYHHFNASPIQWDYLVTELCAHSICKTTAEIKSIHGILMIDSDSGLSTCRASRWRLIWNQIYRVK
ncbi:Aminodeoxychorismate synthase [Fusarium austroafricanum]|uniref:Aminodeoxychorismate synthase n=1 Tax=Fusarium austroafricanum TaxID=2364996 RepID=A0A8H4KUV0_9HYPO|nr:Aminodeoxychorismate synthase [Fusarium austroafricanum]